MNYHNILHCNMNNGMGMRTVLFVSGCSHRCPGCQNPQTWNENSGIKFDGEAMKELMEDLKEDWCAGVTFTGGDPLFIDNREVINAIIKELKSNYPNKNIWLYTGYTFEELQEQMLQDSNLKEIIYNLDVLIDGRFNKELLSPNKPWVGSSNQRIIDVQRSLKEEKIIIKES